MIPHTEVTYLFDPLCGWCYGASPALTALAATPELTVRLAPTGLFSGSGARPMDDGFAAYAWANDQRIERLSGQVFSRAYRDRVLADRSRMFDSGPATLALTAVSLEAPERELETLKAIQMARYVEGSDITSPAVLAGIVRMIGLDAVADRLAVPDQTLLDAVQARTSVARQTMLAFGAQGVPTLIVANDDGHRMLRSNTLFGSVESLLAHIASA
jgi:putative protein-disulfide isomerase